MAQAVALCHSIIAHSRDQPTSQNIVNQAVCPIYVLVTEENTCHVSQLNNTTIGFPPK